MIIEPMTAYLNPFKRQSWVTLPKGLPYRHRGQIKHTGKSYVVKLYNSSGGYFHDAYYSFPATLQVKLPYITWAGSGGYWADASITPELLEANGITELAVDTRQMHIWQRQLDRLKAS